MIIYTGEEPAEVVWPGYVANLNRVRALSEGRGPKKFLNCGTWPPKKDTDETVNLERPWEGQRLWNETPRPQRTDL